MSFDEQNRVKTFVNRAGLCAFVLVDYVAGLSSVAS